MEKKDILFWPGLLDKPRLRPWHTEALLSHQVKSLKVS